MPLARTTTSPLISARFAVPLLIVGGITFAASAGRAAWARQAAVLLIATSVAIWLVHQVIAEVRRVNRPADDAFCEGWEAGYDKGWRDRDAETRPNLVVLPGIASVADESADSCGPIPQISADRASN